MQITIDTTKDSAAHIRQAIKMLQSLLGDNVNVNYPTSPKNVFDSPGSSVSANEPVNFLGRLFDDTKVQQESNDSDDMAQLEVY